MCGGGGTSEKKVFASPPLFRNDGGWMVFTYSGHAPRAAFGRLGGQFVFRRVFQQVRARFVFRDVELAIL